MPVAPAVAPTGETAAVVTEYQPQAAPARKTARLVTAAATQSSFQLAADGQLPYLRLQEGKKENKAEAKSKSVNPLVLIGVLGFSVVMSIIMVFWEDRAGHFEQFGEG